PVAGEAVLVIDKSMAGKALPLMVVVRLAVLLAWLASAWLPSTVAVLVITPGTVGVTTTVIVSVAPWVRLPMASVNTPAVGVSTAPLVVSVAETKVALAGKASTIVTPVALLTASLFLTVI